MSSTATYPNYYMTNVQDQPNSGSLRGGIDRQSYYLATLLAPLLNQQTQFAGQLEPARQAILDNLLKTMGPQGLQALAAQFGAQQMGQATSQGRIDAGMLRSSGASTSAQRGAMIADRNRAKDQTYQYASSLQGLLGQMQAGSQALGLIGNAQNPNLQNWQSLASDVYNKPAAIHQSSPLGSTLGEIAGLASGMGFNPASMFSGGSSPMNYLGGGMFQQGNTVTMY